MLKKLSICLVIIGVFTFHLRGQYSHNPIPYVDGLDTVHIDNVDVVSSVSKKYQVGSKTQQFSSMQKQSVEQSNLAELVSRYAPVYIKTNAGGLSSFHFRGTNSNHTSILVGGLDINSLTLGSSNASSIPLYLFDSVDLMFGSSSATNGSGSIGGSVRMNLSNNWTEGTIGEVKASLGSFGEYMTGAKVYTGNGKFESVTRVMYFQKENDFTFNNPNKYSVENPTSLRDTQKNAAIEDIHLFQEFNYKLNEENKITSFVWISYYENDIQPTMEANTGEVSKNYMKNTNIRTWAKYDGKYKSTDISIGAGYVNDYQTQNDNKDQSIGTQRFETELSAKNSFKKIKYDLGLKYKHISPNVYAYPENLNENRTDLYASLLYEPKNNLILTLNLRQQFVTNFNAPFTPALGVEYNFFSTTHSLLSLGGNLQKSYRIPTLNDRYWNFENNVGNPDIKSEEGISSELGIKYLGCFDNMTFRAQTNYFFMDVDDWILWGLNNNGGWQAQNLQRVISKGLEFSSSLDVDLESININGGLNFTYNEAFRKESDYSSSLIGRQIEYTPKYLSNAFIGVQKGNSGMSIDLAYTGERYYNEGLDKLPSFTLVNVSAYHVIQLGSKSVRVDGQINNILNSDYQNQYRYAMPGINYRIALKYNFK